MDAVQAVTKIPTGAYLTDRVDFATFSSHKFHGLRGVGFVYIKSGKKISPLLTGGGQESDKRSTTENLAGIAATAKALRLSMEKQEVFAQRTAQMKKILLEELQKYPDVVIFSDLENFAPHILTFGIKECGVKLSSMHLKTTRSISRLLVLALLRPVSQQEP